MVGSLVLPKAMYACGVSAPSDTTLRKLRGACCKAVWGQANTWRSSEAVFNLFTKNHVVDPVGYFVYNSFLTARRVLRRRPQLLPVFEAVLKTRDEFPRQNLSIQGPVAALKRACHHGNFTFGSNGVLHHLNENDALEVLDCQWLVCDQNQFAHIIRESTRMEQWSVAAYRREDFMGSQNGVDRKATLELQKQLSGLERHKLRSILCGALATNTRIARNEPEEDGICKCCNLARPETTPHIFQDCPSHNHMRYTETSKAEWESLPNCLKFLGVMPRSFEVLPERYRSEQGRIDLAVLVQHNLLDVWDHRCANTPSWRAPQPRWQRNVKARTSRSQQEEERAPGRGADSQEHTRNVRRRTEEQRQPTRAADQSTATGRNVRARGDIPQAANFVQGGSLQTGEHWRS